MVGLLRYRHWASLLQRVSKFTVVHWPLELRRGAGFVQKVENDYYQVNFSGFNQPSIPQNDQDMLEAAKSLPATDVQYIIEHGEPVSDIDAFKKPKNQRNHFEEVRSSARHPPAAVGSLTPACKNPSVSFLFSEALCVCYLSDGPARRTVYLGGCSLLV